MSCYHPLKGFIIGYKENGKKELKISSYETDHIELLSNGQYIERPRADLPVIGKPYRTFDTIPCGKCIGCRLQYAKEWADRAVLELQYHDSNLFITLTYNDEHLPYSESKDGITHWNLDKRDLQLFWKRLRKYMYPEKIRYLACGEYGDNTFRPHYHAIVFGLKFNDLKFYNRTPQGDLLYTSETLNNIWQKGYCIIGDATHESINYVARYVTKKLYGQAGKKYEEWNLTPPFITMSRKPGIGRQYYEEHKQELFTESRYYFPAKDGAKSAAPGHYFNNLFSLDFDPESVNGRKTLMKKLYQDSIDIELSGTSLNYLDYLADKEYNKENSTKILLRDKV